MGVPVFRRFSRGLTLAFLVAAVSVGLVVAAPGVESASAFCTSSIDPKCAGANLPILVEAGVVSSGGATAVAAPAAGAASTGFGGTVAQLAVTGGTGAVLTGVGMCVGVINVDPIDGCGGPAGLLIDGFPALDFYTNPLFEPAGPLPQATTTFVEGDRRGQLVATVDYGTDARKAGCFRFFNVSSGTEILPANTSATLGNVWLRLQRGSSVIEGTAETMRNRLDSFYVPPEVRSGCSTPWVSSVLGYPTDVVKAVAWSRGGLDGAVTTQPPAPEAGKIKGKLRQRITCKTPGGGSREISFDNTVNVAAGAAVSLAELLCKEGEVATGGSVDWQPEGGTTWAPQVAPQTGPGSVDVEEMITDYPECFAVGASCRLQLLKITDGGRLESCGNIGELCEGWSSTPEADVDRLYRCQYGAHAVSIDLCSAYRAPSVGVLPNVGPNGEPKRYNATVPAPLPNSVGNAPFPGNGPSSIEAPVRAPDASKERECWPSGWGALNPLNWVLKPIQCGLEWAFVPRAPKIADFTAKSGQIIERSALGSVVTGTAGLAAPFLAMGGSSGCSGPPWHFGAFGVDETFYPFSACDEPVAGAASLVNGMLGFAAVAFSIMSVVRYASATIGFVGFGQTHTPSSGGQADGGHYYDVASNSGAIGSGSQRALDR